MRTQQARDEVTIVIATAQLTFAAVTGGGLLAALHMVRRVVGGPAVGTLARCDPFGTPST